MKKGLRILIASAVTLAVAGVGYYFLLPALNVFAEEFWIGLTVLVGIFGVSYLLTGGKKSLSSTFEPRQGKRGIGFGVSKNARTGGIVFTVALLVPVVVLVVGSLLSATMFHAAAYAGIIEVKEAVFEEDMPETDLVSNIALIDTHTAQHMGNREMGELLDMVSQYELNGNYYQINYGYTPQKVSSLEYAGFFRWIGNRDNGIPGYVMVNAVNSAAEYHSFEKPIRYTESAYLSEDLNRKLRFSYPTKIFGSYAFEIDEEGNPYYVVSCMKPKVGLFGAKDVHEVIIFNPVDGSSELYPVGEVPAWVDNVYTGQQASQKYDWHGTLKNGFWNSVIAKKDCKVTTDDFGYIILGDDVWYFTGVTSVVSDESNIGFIVSNARTGEYKFYAVSGAEEYSAMGSAQGAVQEKNYTASFPALINVSGEATYIMTLKDAIGMVKMYALVNVEDYRVVATGETQQAAKQAYITRMIEEDIIEPDNNTPQLPSDTTETVEIEVKEIRFFTIGGESVAYITGSDGFFYKQAVSANEKLILIGVGDRLSVQYQTENTVEEIRQVILWNFVKGEE